MFIDKPSFRESQGNIGEARAILEFAQRGWCVSKPIFDAKYDLVVDDGEHIYRVEVKTSRLLREFKTGNSYEVCISTTTTRQKDEGHIKWSKRGRTLGEFDLLFILTEDGNCWIIPEEAIEGKYTIAVGGTSTKYDKYKIDGV